MQRVTTSCCADKRDHEDEVAKLFAAASHWTMTRRMQRASCFPRPDSTLLTRILDYWAACCARPNALLKQQQRQSYSGPTNGCNSCWCPLIQLLPPFHHHHWRVATLYFYAMRFAGVALGLLLLLLLQATSQEKRRLLTRTHKFYSFLLLCTTREQQGERLKTKHWLLLGPC